MSAFTGGGDTVFSFYRMGGFEMGINMFRGYLLTDVGFEHFEIRFKEYHKPTHFMEWGVEHADR